MASSSLITLSGRIERITYHNRDNHFTIARLKTDENRRVITIKGTMPNPQIGESVEVRGGWESHPRYGQQFKFRGYSELLPATVEGIRSYLQSGFIKGIGFKLVDRIIAHFKSDTLSVIESDAERLIEVTGIGKKTARRIADAWDAHHTARQLLGFLEEIGVDTAYAARLLQTYGNDVIETMCNDPYRLAEDLPGIGFRIADAVVRNADTPVDEEDRAQACIRHLLEREVDRGHTYTTQSHLLERCQKEFDLGPEIGEVGLTHLVREGSVVLVEAPATDIALVFPKTLHESENVIARRIAAMKSIPAETASIDNRLTAKEVISTFTVSLSAEQEDVVHQVLEHRISVITGGPGTGKTTLIRSITAVLESIGTRVLLMAPTGRAARRLAEVTARPAVTLHRALGYNLSDGHFERAEDNQLQAGAIIVDEASMVDTLLMMQLLRAIPVSATLILVGDVFQLPSVGPGNVLEDLILSKTVTTFELKEIFRQDEQSLIVANAHRVRNGDAPVIEPAHEQDVISEFYFMERSSPDQVAQTIVRLCQQEIPKHFRNEGRKKNGSCPRYSSAHPNAPGTGGNAEPESAASGGAQPDR
jgi:exodeoxyribonuclease V alpha subunit